MPTVLSKVAFCGSHSSAACNSVATDIYKNEATVNQAAAWRVVYLVRNDITENDASEVSDIAAFRRGGAINESR